MSVPQPPRSRLQIAVCTTKLGVPPCTAAAIDGNVPAEQMASGTAEANERTLSLSDIASLVVSSDSHAEVEGRVRGKSVSACNSEPTRESERRVK